MPQVCDLSDLARPVKFNESMAPIFYRKMAFIASFNAGVRAIYIRDPEHRDADPRARR